MRKHIDFVALNRDALTCLPCLIRRWLPDGRMEGLEWVARNPLRADRNLGSFKVNTLTGKWADFATGDRGSDVISLVAYLSGTKQYHAARTLAELLGTCHVFN